MRAVIYPGLPSHPRYALAQRLLPQGQSGVISIRLDTDDAGLRRFVQALKIFTLAESLGGVESLINHPWSMTHAAIPQAIRLEKGVTPDLLRISVGIEHAADLQADLAQALATLTASE
ncbi:PLP-dependent transferase [Undibacterium sp. CY22W]|uniref:PLP-dependent transferase n=1 Tax=Undibacterium curvum TaxID=2762294 RepID=A0ABR7A1G5_9BURK|nr:PLP-dependent transferase [Undibacterium curvum]